jgi:predicted ATPase
MDYEVQTKHYLELAEQMLNEAFGEGRRLWIHRVEAELPQIRRIFAWLKEQGDVERGLRLAYLLQEIWFEDQYTKEGLRIIQEFLSMADVNEPSSLQAISLDLAGALALGLNNFEANGENGPKWTE